MENSKSPTQFSGEIDHNDPMQVQREQETKPARTTSGPGETSLPKSKKADRDAKEEEVANDLGTTEEREEGSAPIEDKV